MEEKQEEVDVSNARAAVYAAEHEERMAKMVVGARDRNGYEISTIYAYSDSYKIYGIKGVPEFESLRVAIDTKVEENKVPESRYLEVTGELDKFRSVLHRTGVNHSYMYRAAHALQIALEGNTEKAKALFGEISKDALEEYQEVQNGRLAYMQGAVIASAVVTLLGFLVYLFRDAPFVNSNQVLACYIYAAAFSTFGGLLSISTNIRKLSIEKALGNYKYGLHGAIRQLISILGGVAIVTMIKGDLAFSVINAGGSVNVFAILAISFLAGFSETFVPNSLGKIEAKK